MSGVLHNTSHGSLLRRINGGRLKDGVEVTSHRDHV